MTADELFAFLAIARATARLRRDHEALRLAVAVARAGRSGEISDADMIEVAAIIDAPGDASGHLGRLMARADGVDRPVHVLKAFFDAVTRGHDA